MLICTALLKAEQNPRWAAKLKLHCGKIKKNVLTSIFFALLFLKACKLAAT